MKEIKKYILLPITFILIIIGSAMPYVVSRIQDRKSLDYKTDVQLNVNSLVGRSKDDFVPAMIALSNHPAGEYWEGKTLLSRDEVTDYANDIMKTLQNYNLVSLISDENYDETEWNLEPRVLSDSNGDETILIWICNRVVDGNFVVIDDATGKAIGMMLNNFIDDEQYEKDDVYYKLDQWNSFLQAYYDMEILSAEEEQQIDDDSLIEFRLRFLESDDSEYFELNLDISEEYSFFNF